MDEEIGFFVSALRGGKAFIPTPPKFVKGIETLISNIAVCSATLARFNTLIVRLPNPFLLIVQEMIDLNFIKSLDSCKQRNVVYEAFEVMETVL